MIFDSSETFCVLETVIMSATNENDKTSVHLLDIPIGLISKHIVVLNCFSFFKISLYIYIYIIFKNVYIRIHA